MKRFNEFQLDSANECLWREGNRLPLTPKAFAILSCLVENAGRVVTKDEFMESVWPDVYVGEENLKVYIRELRGLLGDHAAKPRYIETSRDRGYRFIARVTAPTDVKSLLSGRATELNVLNEAFRRASEGNRQCLLVTGEPGIGKTSLVETFLLNASQDFPLKVCMGQCIESYREQEAFYPVLEAFGRLLQEQTGDELSELLGQYAPTWLAQFPSVLTTTARDLLQSQIVGANRDRMLREICQALEALTAKTPLVFVLEDLHWGDHSTLDFIAALARRPEPARLLLIATYRPVEVILSRNPLRQLKSELCLHGQASEVALELLDKPDIAEILTKRFSASIAAELSDGLGCWIYLTVRSVASLNSPTHYSATLFTTTLAQLLA
jgi:DNA-binding winged helix-turn-helix (wHTH) protein